MTDDNAGGGARGLRPVPSPQWLDALETSYGIAAGADIRDIGGSSSLNVLLTSARGNYVVRAYRPYVSVARLEGIQKARRTLAAHGLPCARVVTTREGQPWARLAGGLVEVEVYVDHDGHMDSFERLETGLALLGRVHTVLRGISLPVDARTPAYANYVGALEALPRTLRGTQRIRAWRPSERELQTASAAEALARRVYDAEHRLVPLLPRQLVHGDYWDNNVLFQGERIVLIADLDYAGCRTRIDDAALTLFYYACDLTSSGARSLDDLIERMRALVHAYDAGLEYRLTPAERQALPAAIARQPLWSIGGWVAVLDDEARARNHLAAIGPEIHMALGIMDDMGRWQAALA